MYHVGDLLVFLTRGKRDGHSEFYPVIDAREKNGYDGHHPAPPVALLPHSCGEWIVGGPDEIKALIADLKEARRRMTRKRS